MNSNIFEETYRSVTESSRHDREVHSKLIEGAIELDHAHRTLYMKRKELADTEAEITLLRSKNRESKTQLLQALIKRDELSARQLALESNIERINNQIGNINKETNDILMGQEVDHICERFSQAEQITLLHKIQDNRNKLLKFGFPLHSFA